VVSHLLHLPAPEFKLVYYADLLTSLSRLPNFAPHVGYSWKIRVLFLMLIFVSSLVLSADGHSGAREAAPDGYGVVCAIPLSNFS
jgi:hypothetical protein